MEFIISSFLLGEDRVFNYFVKVRGRINMKLVFDFLDRSVVDFYKRITIVWSFDFIILLVGCCILFIYFFYKNGSLYNDVLGICVIK